MHGIDISHATGPAARLTPEHDGVLVADVVAEWAQRHARPCRLDLTGLAAGAWAFGSGGPALELDAGEFCTAGKTSWTSLTPGFDSRPVTYRPYFFPELAATTEGDEQAAIDTGLIQANRIQYVGQRA